VTTTQIILVAVVVVALIAVLAVRSGGPRVTQIDRTVRKHKDSDDA
jgi:hypothetical protein